MDTSDEEDTHLIAVDASGDESEAAVTQVRSSDDDRHRVTKIALDLKSVRLQCGAGGMSVRTNLTSQEKCRLDPERVRRVMSGVCGPKCKRNCFPRLKLKGSDVLELLEWWVGHLTDEERTFTMSTWYDYSGRAPPSEDHVKQLRTEWSFCDVDICREAFRKIIGVGPSSLVKMTHGIPDARLMHLNRHR